MLLEVVVAAALAATERVDQRAWIVYGPECITKVEKGPKTELRMPMVNGEPDKKHSELNGVVVEFRDGECGHYEVEKVEKK